MWIDPNGNQHDERPQRVRLPDFSTRTAEAVTDELLSELGWRQAGATQVETPPSAFDTVVIDPSLPAWVADSMAGAMSTVEGAQP